MMIAFDLGDLKGIAQCATQSSLLGHGAVPKRNMYAVLKNKERLGADGIVVAHTGSLIGYLFTKKPTPKYADTLSVFFKQLGCQCCYEKARL